MSSRQVFGLEINPDPGAFPVSQWLICRFGSSLPLRVSSGFSPDSLCTFGVHRPRITLSEGAGADEVGKARDRCWRAVTWCMFRGESNSAPRWCHEPAPSTLSRPALRRHRLADPAKASDPVEPVTAGRDWPPKFIPTDLKHAPDQLTLTAVDENCHLHMVTECQALPGGGLRIRHTLTNTDSAPADRRSLPAGG